MDSITGNRNAGFPLPGSMKKAALRSGAAAAILATALSQLLSGLEALILPGIIHEDAYGWWQLYLLYVGFAGILHFGWVDGHYLRIGGKELKSLNRQEESGQLLLLGVFELILCSLLYLFSRRYLQETAKAVALLVCISAFLVCLRDYILYTYQATGRIRRYALFVAGEKLLSTLGLVLLLLSGQRDILTLLLADLIARFLTLLAAVLCSEGLFLSRPQAPFKALSLAGRQISTGFSLMLATLMSMLTLSAVKFILQWRWTVAEYGHAALSLSLAALLLKLVSAGATVLFPALRRMPKEACSRFYAPGAWLSLALIAVVLVFYYPASLLLCRLLPDYGESFRCAGILLGGCIFGCRSAILITPGMNAFGLQKKLLLCNFLGATAAMVAALAVSGLHSLSASMTAAAVGMALSTVLGECVLCRHLHLSPRRELAEESILALCFVLLNGFGSPIGAGCYALGVLLWLLCSRRRIRESVRLLQNMT